ncbi:hypothetical protein BH23CHL8_BH23CHL8_00860 [soil metagenome]
MAALPPRLFRQAKLLQYDLGLRYAESGQFADVFMGPDEPAILSLGGWLLEDLSIHRPDAEQRLFLVSVLLLLRTQALETIDDEAAFGDQRLGALVQLCTERAMRELALLVRSGSPFWEARAGDSLDDLERRLEGRERDEGSIAPGDPELHLRSRWAHGTRIAAMAAAHVAARPGMVGPLVTMVDDLCAAFQVKRELATMHADLLAGRITYPIAVVAQAAGLTLRPRPRPETVLGAMVTTDSLPLMLDSAAARIRRSRDVAVDLGLALVSTYLCSVEERFAEHGRSLAGEAFPASAASHERPSPGPLLRTAEPVLPTVLSMARRFLLADPTLRESWETHREGMLGSEEVASRFPAGLILEILCRRGVDATAQVDGFLAFTAANGFRYYDHPCSDADTDTLGVFLRLLPYATSPERYRAPLDAVLTCLESEVDARGGIPVWITGCGDRAGDAPPAARPSSVALGEGCGTVAAHLLLGLLGDAAPARPDLVAAGSARLLGRIRGVGVAANVNYPPLYALAAFHRLLAALEGSGVAVGQDAGTALAEARALLDAELERAASSRILTAQEAALVAIACRDAGREDLVRPAWIATILRQQRFDGGWAGEPFAAAPNRGGWVTWYSSASLATALCFDALAGLDSGSLIGP